MNKPFVTMSRLGQIGRFGNQIFQYAFLRHYAERHSLAIATGDWDGRALFGHADEAVTSSFPIVYDLANAPEQSFLCQLDSPLYNCDLWGFFQFHTKFYADRAAWFRALFQPTSEMAQIVEPARERLHSYGKTIVGIHLRQGDKSTGRHAVATIEMYQEWLRAQWPRLASPVLFIASDSTEDLTRHFRDYEPVVSSSLGATNPGFYLDFYLLSQCDVVAVSNSTFSFAACMLNERARSFFRYVPTANALEPFDPWDALPVLRDDLSADSYYRDLLATAERLAIPGSSDKTKEFLQLRREIADNWLGTQGEESSLVATFFGTLGQAHRHCMASPLRLRPLSPEDVSYCHPLIESLRAGVPPDWQAPYMLALMLFGPTCRMGVPCDLSALPEYIRVYYLSVVQADAGCGGWFARRQPLGRDSLTAWLM